MKPHIQGIGAIITLAASVMSAKAIAATEFTFGMQTPMTQHATGLIRTAESQDFIKQAPRVSFTQTNAAVPKTYSLRGIAGPVEDQGQCGSCWDFSLTSVLRGTWMTVGGKDPGRLSFNYLLNCATTQQGCNGGDFNAADFFISPKGAPAYGTDGDYTQTSSTCVQAAPVASTISYKFLGTDAGAQPNNPTPSFQDIAYVVGVLHQPVSVDINATDSLQAYTGGVYNDCTDSNVADINHMVVVEGYDCETAVDANGNCQFDAKGNLPAGVGTWLIRNSWGSSFGDNGYFTIKATDSKGEACNSVASDALFYTIK